MMYDQYGKSHVDAKTLCDLLYSRPDLDLSRFNVDDPEEYNHAVSSLFLDLPLLNKYMPTDVPLDDFDRAQQSHWRMPEEYRSLDIAKWILDRCDGEAELQRCGEELMLFQDRDAFDLLRYLKYLVDTLRQNNVVWGVGRGSSVASFVLYKIGVHRINSLEYDLDPQEFLK